MKQSMQNLFNSTNYTTYNSYRPPAVHDKANQEIALQLDQLKDKMKNFIYGYNQAFQR